MKRYTLDGKVVSMDFKHMSVVATGETGNVYKYKDVALKLFKENVTPPIDVTTAKKLTGIQTDRILLPRKLLFCEDKFRGYTYRLISKKGSSKKIITLPKEELIGNISLLENDIENLSKAKILLDGIDPSNYIFNGSLFVTDPSKYSLFDVVSFEELAKLNKFQLHLLLTEIMASELRGCSNITNACEKHFKELLGLKDAEQDSSDYFADIMGKSEDVKELVLSLKL